MALFAIATSTTTKTLPQGDVNTIDPPQERLTPRISLFDRFRARLADMRADFWETFGFDATFDRIEAKRLRREGRFRREDFHDTNQLDLDEFQTLEPEENVFENPYPPEELRHVVTGEDRIMGRRRPTDLKESVKEGAGIIVEGVKDKWQDLHEEWHHAKDKVEDRARDVAQRARGKLHDAKERVEDAAHETAESARHTWHQAKDKVEDLSRDARDEVKGKWEDTKRRLEVANERMKDINEGRGLFYPLLTVISIVCAIIVFGTPNLRESLLSFGERHARFGVGGEEFINDAKKLQHKAKATVYDAKARVEETFGKARRKAH
jgi:hypothetical protein